jgi:hypothetical protein
MSKTPRNDKLTDMMAGKSDAEHLVELDKLARTLELELSESQRYVRIYGAEVKERDEVLNLRDRELAEARAELEKVKGDLAHAKSLLTVRRSLCDEIRAELGIGDDLEGDESLRAGLAAIREIKGERDEAREEAATFEMIGDDMICLYGESNAALTALRAKVGEAVDSLKEYRLARKRDEYFAEIVEAADRVAAKLEALKETGKDVI